jgi:basic membrane protein A
MKLPGKGLTLLMVIAMVLIMSLIVAGCSSKNAPTNASSKPSNSNLTKVALVINGPVNDGGWNALPWQGLQKIKAKYGCDIAVSENVKQSDYESAFRDYANQGYSLIVANGFEFTDAVKDVAPDFPNVKFAILNGGYSKDNVISLIADEYNKGFLAGALAGYMTKTNKVGCIGGMAVPAITNGSSGFKAGAAYTNPKAKMVFTMANSFDDIALGKEIAIAQITAENVDVIYSIASSVDSGAIDGAKSLGKYVIGQPNDRLDEAPGTVIGSVTTSVPQMLMLVADSIAGGTFKGVDFNGSLDNDVIGYGRFGKEVPQNVQDKLAQLVKDIKSGKVKTK